jgi:predicted DNA-binding transcriptional regulator AlpA
MTILRVKDMAKKFKCSRATVYRRIDSGEYPEPFYIGGTPQWIEEEVDAHILRQREKKGAA